MAGAHPSGDGTGQEGFALLAVLGLLLVVTTVVAGFALAARSELDLAAGRLARDRLEILAEGLVTVATRDLSRAAATGGRPAFPLDGGMAACAEDDLAILLRVQDQRGLVDLNAAGADLLVPALRSLGLSPNVAEGTAAAILAYRDPAPEGPMPPFRDGPKGAPFAAIEELHGLPALAAVPRARLARTFTVQSGAARLAGPRLPEGLAAVLPRRPPPQHPLVDASAPMAGTYGIEVFVRGADGTLGAAGRMVGIGEAQPRRIARIAAPEGAPAIAAPPALPCAALFGAGAAGHLAEGAA